MTPPLLELVAVSKTYPGVKALDRVSLQVGRGEVLALIGENGAGKSTLMKILGGVVEPSEGAIRIDGVERASLKVADSMKAGIAFVHQELNLFDNLDVAANVMIGREPLQAGPFRLIDRTALEMAVGVLKENPEIRLGVNVSGTMAEDASWLQSFVEYVRENRDVANRLMIELTETAALHQFEENAQFVSQLREMGCAVAIDDFGAGYTSFRNLRKLGVDIVKIDGAFVQNIARSADDRAFVQTLIDLARRLQIKTVAEWVQDEEAASLLRDWGCDYIQGRLIGLASAERPWDARAGKALPVAG